MWKLIGIGGEISIIIALMIGLNRGDRDEVKPVRITVTVPVQADDLTAPCDHTPPEGLEDMVRRAAKKYNINPRLVALTIYRESDCKADARGASGEIGLMQINPEVWSETLHAKGMVDLWDPYTNIQAGTWILSTLQKSYDTPLMVLTRYNGAGPQAVRYGREQVEEYRRLWSSEARSTEHR